MPEPDAAPLQVTVHRYDPATRSGSAVTDAGVLLPFADSALEGSGLRLLRPGQRLDAVLDQGGREIIALRLGSIRS